MVLSELVASGTKCSSHFQSHSRLLQKKEILWLAGAGLSAERCWLGISNIPLLGAKSGCCCHRACGDAAQFLGAASGAVSLCLFVLSVLCLRPAGPVDHGQ